MYNREVKCNAGMLNFYQCNLIATSGIVWKTGEVSDTYSRSFSDETHFASALENAGRYHRSGAFPRTEVKNSFRKKRPCSACAAWEYSEARLNGMQICGLLFTPLRFCWSKLMTQNSSRRSALSTDQTVNFYKKIRWEMTISGFHWNTLMRRGF